MKDSDAQENKGKSPTIATLDESAVTTTPPRTSYSAVEQASVEEGSGLDDSSDFDVDSEDESSSVAD